MIKDCTIVIPTHERHHYLKRALAYYSDFGCQIFVCDSSKQKYEENVPVLINYIHCPGKEPIEKLSDTFDRVQTKYVILCADDDFLTFTSLNESIGFLDRNPSHSVSQGVFWSYHVSDFETIRFIPLNLETYNLNIDHQEPKERFKAVMNNYMHFIYGVFRTECAAKIYRYCNDNKLKDYILIELIQAIIAVHSGKFKMLPRLHCIREFSVKSTGAQSESLDKIIVNPAKKEEYDTFVKIIMDIYNRDSNVLSKNEINDFIQAYIKSAQAPAPYIPVSEKYKNKSKFQVLFSLYSAIVIKFLRAPVRLLNRISRERFFKVGNEVFFLSLKDQKEYLKIKNYIKTNPVIKPV
jgi:glycosyltransferase domain-containing protein